MMGRLCMSSNSSHFSLFSSFFVALTLHLDNAEEKMCLVSIEFYACE